MKSKLFYPSVLVIWFGCLWQALAFREPDQPALPDFDLRLGPQPPALDIQRRAAAEQLKARIPGVRIDLDAVFAAPKWILNTEGYLSRTDFLDALSPPALPGRNPSPLLAVHASQADPHRAVKIFLDEN